MSREKDTVEIAYDHIEHETAAAKLYDFGDGKIWVPKSVIEDDDGEDGGTAHVHEWFAEKEGLI